MKLRPSLLHACTQPSLSSAWTRKGTWETCTSCKATHSPTPRRSYSGGMTTTTRCSQCDSNESLMPHLLELSSAKPRTRAPSETPGDIGNSDRVRRRILASSHSLLNIRACRARIRLFAARSGSRLQSPRTCVPPSTMPSRRGNMYRSPAIMA
jgi:hypothetical protein